MKNSKVVRPTVGELEVRQLLDAAGWEPLSAIAGCMNASPLHQIGAMFASEVEAQGSQWAAGGRITYSFPPDGTDVFGVPSRIDAELVSRGISEAAWHEAVRMAADAWATATGVRFDEVADDGSPIDTIGPLSGDAHFGDVRIVGVPMTGNDLALTFDPPPSNWGTSAGDIVINTDEPWGIQGAMPGSGGLTSGGVDLPTVLLHELGHTLGVGELGAAAAVEHETYDGVKRMLTSYDTAFVPAVDGGGVGATPTVARADWTSSGHLGGTFQSWFGSSTGPADPAEVDITIDSASFVLLLPLGSTGGPVHLERIDPDGSVEPIPQGQVHMDLKPGSYRFRALADDPAGFGFLFIRPSYTLEEFLPSGVGQAPAAIPTLIGLAVPGQGAGAPAPSSAFATTPTAPAPARASVAAVESAWTSSPSPAAGPSGWAGGPMGRPIAGAGHVSAVGPSAGKGRVALASNGGSSQPAGAAGDFPIAALVGLGATAAPSAEADDRAESAMVAAWEGGRLLGSDDPSLSRDRLAVEEANQVFDGGGSPTFAGIEIPGGLAVLAIGLAHGRDRLDTWRRRLTRRRVAGFSRSRALGAPR